MLKRIIYGTLAAILLTASLLYALYLWDSSTGQDLSMHAYYALGLGIFFTVLLGVALAFLAFLSARLGIDEAAHDIKDKSEHTKSGE